ncbi:MFS general substrate transporter [Amylostereum chailletii]|nr:MFS general substrate transporter [Amylostereum chailletii]
MSGSPPYSGRTSTVPTIAEGVQEGPVLSSPLIDEKVTSRADERRPSQPTEKAYSVFTSKEKWTIVLMASLAGVFSPLTANVYFPAIPVIASQFHKSTEAINLTVTIYMVMQGLRTLSDRWGRRLMTVACMVLLALTCVGLALVPTSDYWLLMLLRCIQAAGSASTIALGTGIIGDIATRAERGNFMGIFGVGPLVGPCIGPVIGGGLSQGLGWRSIFWFLCIAASMCAIGILCFLPETLRAIVGDGSYKPAPLYRPLIPIIGRGRTIETTGEKPPKKPFVNPLRILLYPDIIVLLVFNGIVYAVFYGVLTTISTLFTVTYPELNQTDIGLCFLGIGGGMMTGTIFSGKLLDWDYQRVKASAIRREQSDGEKDLRAGDGSKDDSFPIEVARLRLLPVFLLVVTICVAGYGWCMQANVALAGPLILQIIIGFSVVGIMNTISTILIDLFPTQGSSITACNNLVRCSLGATLVSVIDIITNALKPGWTYVVLAAMCVAVAPLLFIEMAYGPVWRGRRQEQIDRKENKRSSY